MSLDNLKVGDDIYWRAKTPPRNGIGTWPAKKGIYQGMIKGKVLIYWPGLARVRGWKPNGKTMEVDPDQIVEAPA